MADHHRIGYLELPAKDLGAMKGRFHFTDPSGNELAVWGEDDGQG